MRLLIALAGAILVLLAACGGGSTSSSTPTATPTPSPAPVACTASNLYGALVGTEEAQGAKFLSFGITNTLQNCFLSGPPTVNWYDAAGKKLDVMAATVVACQPQAGDYSTCVYSKEVVLPAGAPTPADGVNGQNLTFVTIANVATFAPCPTPNVMAHFIGLAFPDITPDLQIELPTDIELLTCVPQITLQGYGPLATGGTETPVATNTPSAS